MSTWLVPQEKRKIPLIADIYEDRALVTKQNELNIVLNSEPAPAWIKEHPMVSWLKYLPIERVEYLLTCIFARWESHIKEVKLIANSIVVTIELRCQNPLDPTDWIIQTWVWAMPIQTEKWAWAINFDKMRSNAIQIWAPAAESYAIKDAAEKLWKIFGKDLNRKDVISYIDRIQNTNELMEKQNIVDEIETAQTLDELKNIWIHIRQVFRDDDYIAGLFTSRKETLWKSTT